MPITPPNSANAAGVRTVRIEVVPHAMQRYDTCGDYVYDEESGTLEIRVSRTEDWREAMTVAVHELVEALLVIQDGVPVELIDSFDQHFEGDEDEPGEHAHSPYYDQHVTATVVERLMAHAFGLHWPCYEDHIYALSDERASDAPVDAIATASDPGA